MKQIQLQSLQKKPYPLASSSKYKSSNNDNQNLLEGYEHEDHQAERCLICAYPFDGKNRLPILICKHFHKCCFQCVKEIVVVKKQCPFCRQEIHFDRITIDRGVTNKECMLSSILSTNIKKEGNIPCNVQQLQKEMIQIVQKLLNQQSSNVSSNIQVNYSLYMLNYQNYIFSLPLRQRLYHKLELYNSFYCLCYVIVLLYNLPFSIFELYIAMTDSAACLDINIEKYGTLREHFLIAGVYGLVIFIIQMAFLVLKYCVRYPQSLLFPGWVTYFVGGLYYIKLIVFHLMGVLLMIKVESKKLANECSPWIVAYIQYVCPFQTILWIFILVYVSMKASQN